MDDFVSHRDTDINAKVIFITLEMTLTKSLN